MSKCKLTPEQFTILAIKKLQTPGFFGIHTVWSGFNLAFRTYFPNLDPIKTTQELAEQGKIVHKLAKGGARIFLPNFSRGGIDFRTRYEKRVAKDILEKMGL